MQADAKTIKAALKNIHIPEPDGDLEFVRVYVDYYVYRKCPQCSVVDIKANPGICIDCEEKNRRSKGRQLDKESKS